MLKSAEREMHQQHEGNIMGFDLFLAAMSIVAASIATWALLRLFPSSDARQAIPLRTDGGFADPSHTTDGGVTIDGKVTADGESASDIDGQPTDHLASASSSRLS